MVKPGPVELPGVDPGNVVRSLAQAMIDNKKPKAPLSSLVATLPLDHTLRVTALTIG